MNGSKWWVLMVLVWSGCNYEPSSKPDASMPQVLSWPDGAQLEIVATTLSTADLKWVGGHGPIASGDSLGRATDTRRGTTTVFGSLAKPKLGELTVLLRKAE